MITATAVAVTVSLIVLFSTGVSVFLIYSRSIYSSQTRGYRQVSRQDEALDEENSGSTTEEDVIPSPYIRLALAIAAAIGFISALLALSSTTQGSVHALDPKRYIHLAAQALVTCQTVLFLQGRSMQKRFRIGICIAFSSLAILGSLAFLHYRIASCRFKTPVLPDAIHAIACCVAGITALAVPQRATVYHNGQEVDGQYTVSAIEKYTFGWATSLLRRARTAERLEYADLPALDRRTRAADLLYQFSILEVKAQNRPLWRQILACHRSTFIRQWLLTLVESFLLYGPQLCMFKILSMLESLDRKDINKADLWFWVVALAVTRCLHLFIENWLQWINFTVLAIPVRSQLSALAFQKSMKMRDVKETEKVKMKTESNSQEAIVNCEDESIMEMEELLRDDDDVDDPKPNASKNADDKTESGTNNDQTIINLIGVDAQRVSDFCSFNNLLPGTVFTISIAVWFLVNLIGWPSVVAGLMVPVLFIPLNSLATKIYMKAQEGVMKARDGKLAIVKEALQGIRQIKFAANEPQWQRAIMKARECELTQQWRVFAWAVLLMFCWISAPILLGAAAIGTYAWLHGDISPAVAFTALSVFTKLEWSLSVIPTTITELLDAVVSLRRIEKHLKGPEKPENIGPGEDVSFEGATIAWPSHDLSNANQNSKFQLHNMNLVFPKGDISIIDGQTGSGKSLLLLAIAGEAERLEGKIHVPKSANFENESRTAHSDTWIIPTEVALVSQIPWLENDSIRGNILFNLPFNKDRYQETIEACALLPDLKILPDGDLTEIGASGINLSGGQRWRVTFARALYSRAGILLLDDIFSAVDAHVGRHLLDEALDGKLGAGRTRILVTHHVELVAPRASYIVTLSNGGIVSGVSTTRKFDSPQVQRLTSLHTKTNGLLSTPESEEDLALPQIAPKSFVEQESRETGGVKWHVYKAYLDASGGLKYWGITMGVFLLAQSAILGRAWWVEVWTTSKDGHRDENHQPQPPVNHTQIINLPRTNFETSDYRDGDSHLKFYLSIYLLLSLLAAVIGTGKVYFVCVGTIRASRKLFEDLTFAVLRAPLRWHDTSPTGRVLNRFVGDFSLIDSRFAGDTVYFWTSLLSFGTIIFAALIVSPSISIPSVILGGLAVYYTKVYLGGAREIKRLEANAKSPIFELFGSVLMGISTIRASGKSQVYLDRMFERIDTYGRSTWNIWLTTRWMSFRIGALGTVFSVCVAMSVAYFDSINAGLAGFALGFALDYTKVVVDTIRRYAGIELDMNSTERVLEYSRIATESQDGADPPAGWPSSGRMAFNKLEVGYAPDLPAVLQGLSFNVEPRQRIGIVGRTGSGKSSLTLAIFRFLEARSGSISIDGLDISKIRLHDLRHRLAIIPQDPVLFSGTIRSNLDPFGNYSDGELYDTLKQVHLIGPKSPTLNMFDDLNSKVSEGGLNFSQGQRQLLCMARALVSKPKILVLDEATSAVDLYTDELIQESIRTHFSDCTLLVIAHRLSTVVDFDKVLVMSDGKVAEFETPERLMESKGGFWKMVTESGDRKRLEDLISENSRRTLY